ncbi:MAG: thiamine diphosphokinase [Anaerolineales bacterium]
MYPRALIFANGSLPDLQAARRLVRPDDLLLAADGGSRHALALGLLPAAVIGDLDSLSVADRRRLEAGGARLITHPPDKDQTDLELALDFALQQDCAAVVILAALGGRLDQTLANLALLTAPRFAALPIRLDDGLEEAFFVRSRADLAGRPGDLVSLLPWGGPAAGVVTEGLRWPLRAETLYPEQTRGVSNELLAEQAAVSLASGLLLVVHRRQK